MCIYFIQSVDGGLIKIGYADNTAWRLRSIQAMCPVRLQILNTIEDATVINEKHLQRHFSEYWAYDEWYYPKDELLEFIKAPYLVECFERANNCKGICSSGEQCQRIKAFDSEYCHIHEWQKDNDIPTVEIRVPVKCIGFNRDGFPCKRFTTEGNYCANHNPNLVRCIGITYSGYQCKRRIELGSSYCYRHQKQSEQS